MSINLIVIDPADPRGSDISSAAEAFEIVRGTCGSLRTRESLSWSWRNYDFDGGLQNWTEDWQEWGYEVGSGPHSYRIPIAELLRELCILAVPREGCPHPQRATVTTEGNSTIVQTPGGVKFTFGSGLTIDFGRESNHLAGIMGLRLNAAAIPWHDEEFLNVPSSSELAQMVLGDCENPEQVLHKMFGPDSDLVRAAMKETGLPVYEDIPNFGALKAGDRPTATEVLMEIEAQTGNPHLANTGPDF